jgi:hypothetical protein
MVFIGTFGFGTQSFGQIEPRIRKAIFDTLFVYANVTTELSWNKHPNISKFNRNLKLGLTQPYCSSYLLYGYHQCGIYPPLVTGVAYSWRKKANIVFWPAMIRDEERVKRVLQQMDVVVMTWSHVEGYHSIDFKRNEITNIAGNTRGGRKTEGVYFPVNRNIRYVLGIYNFITPYLKLHEEELKRRYSF